MKILFKSLLFMAMVVSGIPPGEAEMMPIEPGTVKVYDSRNGVFQARVSYGNMGMASLALYNGGTQLWSQPITGRPGTVAAADNGQTVVMTSFGWEDEGGSNGLLIYNEKGEATKQITFKTGDLFNSDLKWVKVLEVSPDGKFIALGESFKKSSSVTVYDVASGTLAWEQEVGYPDIAEICLGENAESVIVATRNYESGMMFLLLDKEGKTLSTKAIENNFSYDVPVYVRIQDDKPEVFDIKSGMFVPLQ